MKKHFDGFLRICLMLALGFYPVAAGAAIVKLTGDSFKGGGADRFGHNYDGANNVNFIYAQPTGALSSMTATFNLSVSPTEKMAIQLRGRDDDGGSPTHIRIAINGVSVFSGECGFSHQSWGERRFAIPDHVLKAGRNDLTISNLEPKGESGNPPWFMIARATLAAPGALPIRNFQVQLPATVQQFPHPAPADAPRFKLRGTKGYDWTPAQYLAEIPYLKKARMNFLMNCYLSMMDQKTGRNNWWEPFSADRKNAYAKVVKACQNQGIHFCFAMHPQLRSDRPLNLTSTADFEKFFRHFAWMQSLGVHWFSVSMDDVGGANQALLQANFCNKFLHRLREKDPTAQLIFCPTVYATSQMRGHEGYLPALNKALDKDVYIFWTGPDVVSLTISREDAEYYKKLVGHRIIIWDNYPVNDGNPTLHLGPITGRDPELCQLADGYMANPMFTQNQINRIPLYTMADYAYNPDDYDPMRSIAQAIVHLADTPAQQRAMADLVESYPGDIIFAQPSTGFNAVRFEYGRLTQGPSAKMLGAMYIHGLQKILAQFRSQFPSEYKGATQLLQNDVAALQRDQKDLFPTTASPSKMQAMLQP